VKRRQEMFQIWEIQQVYLAKALDLAAELMSKAGYAPTTKSRGIVEWKEEKDVSGHTCYISFKSYRGVLNGSCRLYGYITVQSCDCENIWAFNEIAKTLEREFKKLHWINEERLQFLPLSPHRARR
jgi:hypothetical protein